MSNYQSVRKPHGTIIISDPALPHEIQADTLRCCHCGLHWVVERGSGRVRGFCLNCMGPTCGQANCVECMHVEKKIELIEAGKLSPHLL